MRLINRLHKLSSHASLQLKRTKQELDPPACGYRGPRKELTKRNSLYITQLFYNR